MPLTAPESRARPLRADAVPTRGLARSSSPPQAEKSSSVSSLAPPRDDVDRNDLIAEMEADDRDFLKTQFLAAISQDGRVWVERDDASRLLAGWFGFRRAGPQIQDTAKSLINGLIREQRLEAQGTCIRRAARSGD